MHACFILLQGAMSLSEYEPVWRRVPPPTLVKPGDVLGKGAWLQGAMHLCTATAQTACVVLVLRVSEARADARFDALTSRLSSSLGTAWTTDALRFHVPVFRDLPVEACAQLAPLLVPYSVPPHTKLIREGDPGAAALFILVLGCVECYRRRVPGVKGAVRFGVITAHSEVTYFGENELLENTPSRTSSIRTLSTCLILELSRVHLPCFERLVPGVRQRAALVATWHAKKVELEREQRNNTMDCRRAETLIRSEATAARAWSDG